jgi:hypothetical protein
VALATWNESMQKAMEEASKAAEEGVKIERDFQVSSMFSNLQIHIRNSLLEIFYKKCLFLISIVIYMNTIFVFIYTGLL